MPVKNRILLIALMVLALASGCSNQSKRPTQDVIMAEEALRMIEHLRAAYAARDMAGLEALCSAEAWADIKGRMSAFKALEIVFTPGWVDILQDNSIRVRISWAGKWSMATGSQEQRSGNAVLLLSDRPLVLQKVEGRSPFAEPRAEADGNVR